MRVSINQILITCVLLGLLLVSFAEMRQGLAMAFASMPILLFSLIGARRKDEKGMILIAAAGSIWVVYLIHPVLLILVPDLPVGFFDYVTPDEHISALTHISFFGFGLLGGVWLGLGGRDKKQYPCLPKRDLLLRLETLLFVFLCVLFLIHTGSATVDPHGVGSHTIFDYLRKILPVDFVLPLVVIFSFEPYLKKHAKYRKFYPLLLVGWPLTTLVGGSKGALFFLLMYVVLRALISKPNRRLSLSLVFIALLGGVLAVASFQMGRVFSLAAKNDINLLDSSGLKLISSRFGDFDGQIFLLLLNDVASRFIGYQGIIAVEKKIEPALEEVLEPQNVFQESLRSLPGFNFKGYTSGKIVSMYYLGIPEDKLHGASLGLFACIYVLGGSIGGTCLLGGVGFLYGSMIRLVKKYSPSEGIKKTMLLVGMYLFVHLLIGNLGARLGASYVIVGQAFVYSLVFWIIIRAASAPSRDKAQRLRPIVDRQGEIGYNEP